MNGISTLFLHASTEVLKPRKCIVCQDSAQSPFSGNEGISPLVLYHFLCFEQKPWAPTQGHGRWLSPCTWKSEILPEGGSLLHSHLAPFSTTCHSDRKAILDASPNSPQPSSSTLSFRIAPFDSTHWRLNSLSEEERRKMGYIIKGRESGGRVRFGFILKALESQMATSHQTESHGQ